MWTCYCPRERAILERDRIKNTLVTGSNRNKDDFDNLELVKTAEEDFFNTVKYEWTLIEIFL